MTTKYYLKEKCTACQAFDDNAPHRADFPCNGTGFTRGADVTELMNRVFEISQNNVYHGFSDLIKVVEE